ncbi:motility associated factor glycosyltransferase family protein [Campylobacter upsaliensis]|nr:motility associated factor glycosyltransferase family protein [Campylobacter upsaliensis]EHJ8978427.1 motility associated factor glycosyltransferase family protein [Campylobacter upsaliensis]EKC1470296.1 motility associated factor glycosyltransferase family protein [Campylobacter upsaliensis]QOQ93041.1 motility associated factor glycosyltransferase family protein [Campylobacter upsaliensis]HEC1283819.1 motility associated factor glycosyltransferase family protein [Campylobacter upsaliensis]
MKLGKFGLLIRLLKIMKMNEILSKNLNALRNDKLKNKLLSFINEGKFERFSIDENLNIFDKQNQVLMYEDMDAELIYVENAILSQTKRYPFIFIYGIGNALLLKRLCKAHYQHIFVLEGNLELLILALSKVDLSGELNLGGIHLLDSEDPFAEFELSFYFNNPLILELHSLYGLFIQNSYYEKFFHQQMLNADLLCRKVINNVLNAKGVSIPDAIFKTYKNFLFNAKTMLYNPPFQRLLSQRKKSFKNAIVVSAGPSLSANLTLLKKYEENFVIFCVDGAYSVLCENGITPDYVINNDYLNIALKFFEADIKEETMFICSSLSSFEVVETLGVRKNLCVILDPEDPNVKLNFLDDFGYIKPGLFVSYFAYCITMALGFENVIMLGQDLAFSKEGNSHTDGFSLGVRVEADIYEEYFEVEGFGGGGHKVLTHPVWNIYRIYLEGFIANHAHLATFYNVSQTGARIHNAVELSFKECCERFAANIKPHFEPPKTLTINKTQKLFDKFIFFVKENIKACEEVDMEALALQNALISILNSNKDLPLEFLQKVDLNIRNFNTILINNHLLQDGKLGHCVIKRGDLIAEVYKKNIIDEKEFLLHIIVAFAKWLEFFRENLKIKKDLLEEFLSRKV